MATLRRPKIIVYATNGIGKTTFGASAPNHYLLNMEDGLGLIEANESGYLESWKEIEAELDKLVASDKKPKTLVIDTLDWMIRRGEESITGSRKDISSTLSGWQGGWGRGNQALENVAYNKIIPKLSTINRAGVTIIMLSHATKQDVMSPDGAMIESIAPKIHKSIAPVFQEWADIIGLLRIGDNGSRSMVVQPEFGVVAKNRYNLPPVIDVTDGWPSFVAALKHFGLNKGESNGQN